MCPTLRFAEPSAPAAEPATAEPTTAEPTTAEPTTAGPVDPSMPDPVRRWLEIAWPDWLLAGVPRLASIALVGHARLRRGGTGPAVRVEVRSAHALGLAHVEEVRMAVGPVTLGHGLDAYVDGHGVVRLGPHTLHGPDIDQGACALLWSEAFLFPMAWAGRPGTRWVPVHDHAAVLELPLPAGTTGRGLVRFDAGTGMPLSFAIERHRHDGPLLPWTVTYGAWWWCQGVPVPGSTSVRWGDEPRPWLEGTIDAATPDAPVDDALAAARDLLATAMGTARG